MIINWGYHEELDRAKETFETLDETLSEVGRQVLQKHQELISLKVVSPSVLFCEVWRDYCGLDL